MADLTSAPHQPAAAAKTAAYRVQIGDQSVTVMIVERDERLFLSIGDGPEQSVEVAALTADGELSALVGGVMLRGLIGHGGHGGQHREPGSGNGSVTVVVDGYTIDVVVQDERAVRLASAAAAVRPTSSVTAVRAPMPGLVVAVPVSVGDRVTRGTTLVVLSAMKMQNELTAPADGTVTEVLATAGQTVDQQEVLVQLGGWVAGKG